CRSLQQVCTNFVSIETRVTGRRVFAELEHELKRRDAFETVDGRLSIRVKHLAAEGPEDRHEVSDGRVTLCGAHDVAVHLRTGFFLLDGFSCRERVVPRRWRLQRILLKKIFAIKK